MWAETESRNSHRKIEGAEQVLRVGRKVSELIIDWLSILIIFIRNNVRIEVRKLLPAAEYLVNPQHTLYPWPDPHILS